jgi:hypothetical protein
MTGDSITQTIFWAIASLSAGLMVVFGFYFLYFRLKDRNEKEIGADELQLVGLVLIIPTILLVGLTGLIKGEALATLLGAVAGYVFGKQVSAPPKSSADVPQKGREG